MPHSDPVHKISIVSRGQALGVTISMPTEDKFNATKAELEDRMAMTLGGRSAEELVFSEITTGASNDLERVTAIAKQMTMRFGMSERLGPRVLGHAHGAPFLGRDIHSEPDYSDETAREIDAEIRRIIEEAHTRARAMLEDHKDDLERLSQILLRRETIEREEFLKLLDGVSEADVFRAKDEANARKLAEDDEAPAPSATEEQTKRLPYPPAAGRPVPEA
jgi:cell division protease FtsH